ncbi:reverse transcriptase domain-containing protein [Tanacetum coccineum]
MKKTNTEDDECYRIDDLDTVIQSAAQELLENKNLEYDIIRPDYENHRPDSEIPIRRINHINTPYPHETQKHKETLCEHLYSASAIEIDEKKPELKDLPSHLESNRLEDVGHQGNKPVICTHKNLLEESFKPVIQPQRRLNLKVQDVVKEEIVRFLPNLNRTERSKEDNLHLSLRDFCLQKDVVRIMQRFDCKKAFNKLKERLTTAPIIISLDWNLPFELMCDASDFAIEAVLGQRIEGKFKPIYYASKTLNNAQAHYTTIEKELLAVVFSFNARLSTLILLFSKTYRFNIEIKDKKGAENLAANHLSRLENPNIGELCHTPPRRKHEA